VTGKKPSVNKNAPGCCNIELMGNLVSLKQTSFTNALLFILPKLLVSLFVYLRYKYIVRQSAVARYGSVSLYFVKYA
jgi:hypothetical protein